MKLKKRLSSKLSGTKKAESSSDPVVKADAIARQYFPGAIGSSTTLSKVASILKPYGFTAANTLFAQSMCPDEINHEIGDITDLFFKQFGEVFHLGGLAGIPFAGKTGFGAFSHHVPDGGHCFVLMAPHIGITDDMQLGLYSRYGQTCAGTACGAAIGAYRHCCSGNPIPDLASCDDDFQMCYIINEISKVTDIINEKPTKNERQAELAMQTWKIGKKMLDKIINTDFGDKNSKLMVLTGIQINMPREFEDFFLPLSFDMHSKDGTVTDLLEKTFKAGEVQKREKKPKKFFGMSKKENYLPKEITAKTVDVIEEVSLDEETTAKTTDSDTCYIEMSRLFGGICLSGMTGDELVIRRY